MSSLKGAKTVSSPARVATPERSSAPDPASQRVSPWVKALVAFHLVGIVAWSLPRPRADILSGKVSPVGSDYLLVAGNSLRLFPPLSIYVQSTGTWQYWDMFAPDPSSVDIWADAEVELQDGTRRIVGYPRMFALSIPDKYLKERYRKLYERAGQADYSYMWPAFAIQLASELPYDPKNPPVAVTLRKHVLRIVPPGEKQPTEYSNEPYYRYIVQPGDLGPDGPGPGR